MLLSLTRRMLACCLFATGFMLLQPDTARAQVEGPLSERPIAIFYAGDMSQKRIFAYAINLSDRMEFKESVQREIATRLDVEETERTEPDSVDGYLLYLVSGPISDVKSVPFCRVGDTAEARRRFEADLRNEGDGWRKREGNRSSVCRKMQ